MGGNSTPLRGLPVYLHALGLSWLQPKGIANFTLEDIGKLSTQNQLLVGSLYASDGTCNHAITVFNGLVFDSNEATSLPLLQDTLNYLVSTKLSPAEFLYMKKGYIFTDQKKRSRIGYLLQRKKHGKIHHNT